MEDDPFSRAMEEEDPFLLRDDSQSSEFGPTSPASVISSGSKAYFFKLLNIFLYIDLIKKPEAESVLFHQKPLTQWIKK